MFTRGVSEVSAGTPTSLGHRLPELLGHPPQVLERDVPPVLHVEEVEHALDVLARVLVALQRRFVRSDRWQARLTRRQPRRTILAVIMLRNSSKSIAPLPSLSMSEIIWLRTPSENGPTSSSYDASATLAASSLNGHVLRFKPEALHRCLELLRVDGPRVVRVKEVKCWREQAARTVCVRDTNAQTSPGLPSRISSISSSVKPGRSKDFAPAFRPVAAPPGAARAEACEWSLQTFSVGMETEPPPNRTMIGQYKSVARRPADSISS